MRCISLQVFTRLRNDIRGSIDCAGYLLMATILGLGMLVGITTYRDQVVQEFGDVADSLQSIDQSYSFTIGNEEHRFDDENTDSVQPNNGDPPAGISINEPPTEEKDDAQDQQP